MRSSLHQSFNCCTTPLVCLRCSSSGCLNRHFLCPCFITVLGLIPFFFLLAIWIVGWSEGYSFVTASFSYMLATSNTIYILFWVWYGWYVLVKWIVATIVVLYTLESKYDPDLDYLNHWRNQPARRAVSALSILYYICQLTQFCALPFVAVFKVNSIYESDRTNHFIVASVTFISAMVGDFCLVLRLLLILVYHDQKPLSEREGGGEKVKISSSLALPPAPQTRSQYFLYIRNIFIISFVWFLLEVLFALLFLFLDEGWAEFFLTMYIGSSYFFIICHLWSDQEHHII